MNGSRGAEHAADTRQALIGAARELFVEQGAVATGTEQIVARARVTRGALYHHFQDKSALVRAVLEQVAQEVAEQLTSRVLADPEGPADAWEQLRSGFHSYLDVCMYSDFQRLVLIDGPAALGYDAWTELLERPGYGLLSSTLAQAIDQGSIASLPLDALSRLLGSLVAEASVYIARADDPARARAEAGTVLDRMLDGLASAGEPVGPNP